MEVHEERVSPCFMKIINTTKEENDIYSLLLKKYKLIYTSINLNF